jgi:hypothetical protein
MVDDVQATLYAAWGYPEQGTMIDLQWTYGLTKGPQ